jgi:uncharacterized protein
VGASSRRRAGPIEGPQPALDPPINSEDDALKPALADETLNLPNTILLSALAFLGPQLVAGLLYGIYLTVTGHPSSDLEKVSDTVGIALTLGSSLLGVALVAGFLSYKKLNFFKFFGLIRSKFTSIKWAFAVVIPYFVLLFTVTYGLGIIFKQFNSDQAQELPFKIGGAAPLMTLLMGISLVLVVPIVEEILFRGILFRGLKNNMNWVLSAVITSALFGAAHGQWNVAADTFLLSMIMCWMVNKTESIWPSIALHMMKNGVAFLALLFIA